MPLTHAHPAIFAPFSPYKDRLNLSITGLVIGSISPDIAYYLAARFLRFTVVFPTNFLVGLPLAYLIAWAFHNWWKQFFVRLLPRAIVSWYPETFLGSWSLIGIRSHGVFVFSWLIGLGSHYVLDGFTHDNGFFVQEILGLQSSYPYIPYPGYQLLQFTLSVIGIIILGITFLATPKSTKPLPHKYKPFQIGEKKRIIVLLFLLYAVSAGLLFWVQPEPDFGVAAIVLYLTNAGIYATCAVALLSRVNLSFIPSFRDLNPSIQDDGKRT